MKILFVFKFLLAGIIGIFDLYLNTPFETLFGYFKVGQTPKTK